MVLVAAILATLAAVLPVLHFARRRRGYSRFRQTISELGEAGAPDEKKVAIFAFAPAGHAVWLFVVALAFAVPALADGAGLWLLALLGAGYVGAAMFPCDPGAPLWGTWRNNVHNVAAAIGYFGGAGGIVELGRAMEDVPALAPIADVSQATGIVAFLCIFLMSFHSPIRGLIQRIIEMLLHGWMLLIGVMLALNT